MQAAQSRDRLWWAAVAGSALVGLALRLAAARRGLWTDEAWSAIYAAQARDPIGVFLRINHDNNHHLNSLWLQAIGLGAPPLLARAPSIVAGSLGVVVAAMLAGRRSRAAGLVAALLFAVSPILVIYGSEARGYATMLLAALLTLLIVDGAVDGRPVRRARWWLAALALGHVVPPDDGSQRRMSRPCGSTLRAGRLRPDEALTATVRLMGPALAAPPASSCLSSPRGRSARPACKSRLRALFDRDTTSPPSTISFYGRRGWARPGRGCPCSWTRRAAAFHPSARMAGAEGSPLCVLILAAPVGGRACPPGEFELRPLLFDVGDRPAAPLRTGRRRGFGTTARRAPPPRSCSLRLSASASIAICT